MRALSPGMLKTCINGDEFSSGIVPDLITSLLLRILFSDSSSEDYGDKTSSSNSFSLALFVFLPREEIHFIDQATVIFLLMCKFIKS